jgi:hypothetical protein
MLIVSLPTMNNPLKKIDLIDIEGSFRPKRRIMGSCFGTLAVTEVSQELWLCCGGDFSPRHQDVRR